MNHIRPLLSLMFLAILISCNTALAADENVKIKTWKVDQQPRDVAVAPDGYVWFTDSHHHLIGRFDPKTQQSRAWITETPKSGPHGIALDNEGNIWFAAHGGGVGKPTYIGKFDPKTEKFTHYPLKLAYVGDVDFDAAGAVGLAFDHEKKNLWITILTTDMIGRLNIQTGEVTIAHSPQLHLPLSTAQLSGPYGIALDSNGIPFWAMFYTNKLGSIDPVTMAVHLYEVPNRGARPRRVAFTPDNMLWYTDYERGMLGRLDPKTGKITEWPSPGGAWSYPCAIIAIGNIIWYNEAFLTPSMMVRFDTETQKFQSWPIEHCNDGMHGAPITRDLDGNIWFACHETDRIGKIEIKY